MANGRSSSQRSPQQKPLQLRTQQSDWRERLIEYCRQSWTHQQCYLCLPAAHSAVRTTIIIKRWRTCSDDNRCFCSCAARRSSSRHTCGVLAAAAMRSIRRCVENRRDGLSCCYLTGRRRRCCPLQGQALLHLYQSHRSDICFRYR